MPSRSFSSPASTHTKIMSAQSRADPPASQWQCPRQCPCLLHLCSHFSNTLKRWQKHVPGARCGRAGGIGSINTSNVIVASTERGSKKSKAKTSGMFKGLDCTNIEVEWFHRVRANAEEVKESEKRRKRRDSIDSDGVRDDSEVDMASNKVREKKNVKSEPKLTIDGVNDTEEHQLTAEERFANKEDSEVPAFHFGTHYSTQAFTLNWLFRLEPFTTLFLDLQNGKFDHSNRLFHSMAETWEHCLNDTHAVLELVPELFYLPEMFINNNNYELGTREDGAAVNNVCLPPWCNGIAETFVHMHRQALESDLVSCQLHQWVDLIFGYKQHGLPEAVKIRPMMYTELTYDHRLIDDREAVTFQRKIKHAVELDL